MRQIESRIAISEGTTSAVTTSPTFRNQHCKGGKFVTKVTSGNVKVSIYGLDEADNAYLILETSYTGAGTNVMNVFPGLTTGTGVSNDIIPARFYVVATPSGSATFGVCYDLIP